MAFSPKQHTVFAEINAHPEISAHQKQWFFKGGSTWNRWGLMDDFSKEGVHKTDGFWWVIFQRGEYTKPMGFDGWFFKRGGVHKTDELWWMIFQRGEYTKPMGFDGWFFKGGSTQNRWGLMGDFSKGGVNKTNGLSIGDFSKGGVHKTEGFWNVFLLLPKIKRPGRLFQQIRYHVLQNNPQTTLSRKKHC